LSGVIRCTHRLRDSAPERRECILLKKRMRAVFDAAMFRRARGERMTSIDLTSLVDTQARVLEEWFRLPESRRRDATDAVAFAYRLLRDQPELFAGPKEVAHESIVNWLLPHLTEAVKTG
jgi:hypothetical protein